MKKYNVAIVGATGAVGQQLLTCLAERNFPIGELRLLASARSKGKVISYCGTDYVVDETTEDSFAGIDIALFAGGAASKMYAAAAVNAGAVVIDNSSSFRYDPEVPLVVPEVNPEDVRWHKGIIANPNCSTIQMVVALKPLHDAAKIKRIVVSTYQAASGAGVEGLNELRDQAQILAADPNAEITPSAFAHQLAFNVIPHIDVFQDNDYTKEEMKMHWETQKMFHDNEIRVSATAVRVPVYRSHSEAVSIETERKLTAAEAKEILKNAPGVVLQDDIANKVYPMPLLSSDTDLVYVGRVREDISCDNGLCLWVVADQIRKGAATNAVQIAELLVKEELV
ncbi:MAG: aspartate-semialdehyde dehydrogenase [Firmicutes bacterium]|nr:aspartate-semialdehyde dehydrogenase [Bacillota bacterium]MBQ6841815.1 aspartate-semialdehyde dehydrogenase [Bacillota bacterium]